MSEPDYKLTIIPRQEAGYRALIESSEGDLWAGVEQDPQQGGLFRASLLAHSERFCTSAGRLGRFSHHRDVIIICRDIPTLNPEQVVPRTFWIWTGDDGQAVQCSRHPFIDEDCAIVHASCAHCFALSIQERGPERDR